MVSVLVDSMGPRQNATIDCTNLPSDALAATAHAIDVATRLGVPQIMDAIDMVSFFSFFSIVVLHGKGVCAVSACAQMMQE